MPSTPVYGLPYPELGDPPDGPAQIGALAEAVESELVRIEGDIADLGTRVVPIAHLRQTVSQNLSSATFTPITFTTEDIDTVGGHSTVSNTSRWTCPTGWAGAYLLNGGIRYAVNTTGSRTMQWGKNGTRLNGSQATGVIGSVTSLATARSYIVSLAVGDYVELYGYQSSGITLATDTTALETSTMSITWLGPIS